MINNYLTNIFRNKFIRNSLWLLVDKGARLLLGLVITAWVARYLGPESFGEFSLILTFLALFQAIAYLGLNGIVVRDLANERYEDGSILFSVVVLRIIVGLIGWLLFILLIALYSSLDSNIILLATISGGVLVFQAAETIDLWFQSQSKSKITVLCKLITYSISGLIRILFILFEQPLYMFMVALLVEWLIIAVCLIYAFKINRCKNKLKYSAGIASNYLKESMPYLLSSISVMLYMRVDQVFIEYYLGKSELGIYASIIPLSNILTTLFSVVGVSLAPLAAKKKAESQQKFELFISNLTKAVLIGAFFLCIISYSLSETLITILYGEEYIVAASVFKIYLFSNIFIAMGMVQSLWILNEQKGKMNLDKTLFGLFFCIILNILLIPKFGLYGAALTAVISQFSANVLFVILFAKKLFKVMFKDIFNLNFKI